jgi:hypothetical protein
MREHLGFLETSSTAVKVAAWIFLFFGVVGGVSVFTGIVHLEGTPRWMGLLALAVYAFMFFFLFLIAKIADLLIKIINEIHELKK